MNIPVAIDSCNGLPWVFAHFGLESKTNLKLLSGKALHGGLHVVGSVTDVDEQQRNISQATGFSFYNTEVSDATMALRDALNYWVRAYLLFLVIWIDLLTEEHGYDLHMALNKHKYVQFLIFNSKNGRNQHLQFSRLQKPWDYSLDI